MRWWALVLGCTTVQWFGPAPEGLDADCPPNPASRAPIRRVSVEVRVANGLAASAAARHTAWAGEWWRAEGVALEGVAQWSRTRAAPIFGQGPGPADMVRPLEGRLSASEADVVVVFVPELAEKGSPAAAWFEPLVGFTVVPALARGEDALAQAFRDLGVGPTTVPTVFVALDALDRLPEERARFVLAHEVGHALGLEHVPTRGNLMGPGFPRCRPHIGAAQRAGLGLPAE